MNLHDIRAQDDTLEHCRARWGSGQGEHSWIWERVRPGVLAYRVPIGRGEFQRSEVHDNEEGLQEAVRLWVEAGRPNPIPEDLLWRFHQ